MESFYPGKKQVGTVTHGNERSHGETGFEGNYDAMLVGRVRKPKLLSSKIEDDSPKHV